MTCRSFHGRSVESDEFRTDDERLRGSILAAAPGKLSRRDSENLRGLRGRKQRGNQLC
jgi:hypothetical protein